MHRPIEIIDDFYTEEELNLIFSDTAKDDLFSEGYQPYKHKAVYSSRFQAYPCHETNKMPEDSAIFVNLKNKLNSIHPEVKHDEMYTFFRKIYKDEILKSVCKDGKGAAHTDEDDCIIAGVIYLDKRYSFNAGTNLFTLDKEFPQFEQDIQVGSKFNRCIIYPSDILHQALYDLNIDSRFIQVFFVCKEEKSNNEKKYTYHHYQHTKKV